MRHEEASLSLVPKPTGEISTALISVPGVMPLTQVAWPNSGSVPGLRLTASTTNGASVRATIPRAINCPTVEQYAAGLVLGFARDNLNTRFAVEGTWYRVSMTFDLPE